MAAFLTRQLVQRFRDVQGRPLHVQRLPLLNYPDHVLLRNQMVGFVRPVLLMKRRYSSTIMIQIMIFLKNKVAKILASDFVSESDVRMFATGVL